MRAKSGRAIDGLCFRRHTVRHDTTSAPPAVTPRRIAVIGAGAAGTMAAIFATGPETEVVLCEGTRDGGR